MGVEEKGEVVDLKDGNEKGGNEGYVEANELTKHGFVIEFEQDRGRW